MTSKYVRRREKHLLKIAEAIKAEAGVVEHHIPGDVDCGRRTHWFGWAFPRGKVIHAPAALTVESLYILAHECAHVALRHHLGGKPRWRREYEAELWAHAALRRHHIRVRGDQRADAAMNVFFAISDANERGKFGRPKRLAAEAAEWSGWNLWLQDEAQMAAE
jgi:hypothetical protein